MRECARLLEGARMMPRKYWVERKGLMETGTRKTLLQQEVGWREAARAHRNFFWMVVGDDGGVIAYTPDKVKRMGHPPDWRQVDERAKALDDKTEKEIKCALEGAAVACRREGPAS
jgi:hypothetical protein